MKFALVNPNWNFKGSTYFGCPDPHVPLELLFAHDQVLAAGHQSLVVDAQTENLSLEETKVRIDGFGPGLPCHPNRAFLSLLALSSARAACSHGMVPRFGFARGESGDWSAFLRDPGSHDEKACM